MRIDIAKEDVWKIRTTINDAIWQKENCPNPSAWGDTPKVLRKFNRKLNRALKKAYGHDYSGDAYYT